MILFKSFILLYFYFFASSSTLEEGQKLIFRICHGCCLKHRKNAQAFVYKDLPQFESRLELEYMPNSKPTLIIRDQNNNEYYSLDVSKYSRLQLRETVKRFGIKVTGKLKPLPNENEILDNEENIACDDMPRLDSEL